ncbi:hypothetical protein DPMN_155986 [Dreissena polymorpha]|uniref:Uncharacterized protein n=1 Tax=Dreissena polymorpha TaxID=45954 RepID=A0A9D4J751_DREPO|nr:hypothetical protein DPMN_155986 [Dreissena polymorpha]
MIRQKVTSRVFTRKTATPPTLSAIVFTCFHYIHIEKTAPPNGGHVFSLIWTIFELVRDINKTNGLSKFHTDWTKSQTNVLTKFYEDLTKNLTSKKTAPPPGGHVFSPIWTIFELVRDINKTNVLTKFHDDLANIVTSRVFAGFKLDRVIIGTNLLTKIHEDRTRNTTVPPTGGHVFQRTRITFELNLHIIKPNILTNFEVCGGIIAKNLLTMFHEDRTRNVASRVFTSFKLDRGIIATNLLTKFHEGLLAAIFELDRGIIGTNLLTKFHEDQTRNVASRVFTN